MSKLTKLQLVCAAVMAILGAGIANAFNTSMYANSSKLAMGKWVKITIPENGVYEITYDELREMGFSNPERVTLFGFGGAKISETLSGATPDDMRRVPLLRSTTRSSSTATAPSAST